MSNATGVCFFEISMKSFSEIFVSRMTRYLNVKSTVREENTFPLLLKLECLDTNIVNRKERCSFSSPI